MMDSEEYRALFGEGDWREGDADDDQCDHCGAFTLVCELEDPRIRELHPEQPNPKTRWCIHCHTMARGDI